MKERRTRTRRFYRSHGRFVSRRRYIYLKSRRKKTGKSPTRRTRVRKKKPPRKKLHHTRRLRVARRKIVRRPQKKKPSGVRRTGVRRIGPRRVIQKRPTKSVGGWVPLEHFVRSLYREFPLNPKRQDDFQPWLNWAYMGQDFSGGSKFLWRYQQIPPFDHTYGKGRQSGSFATLSIWYVVRDDQEHGRKDHALRVYRIKLREAPDFDEIVENDLPRAVERIEEIIENIDYLEFIGAVAWTATPVADWTKHEMGRRKYFAQFERDRKFIRKKKRVTIHYSDWSKRHPYKGP